MQKLSQSSWLFKLSILSISILAMTAPSISIATPMLLEVFPHQTVSQIEMIGTLPNLGVLLLMLFSTAISHKLGIKRTIMIGLLLYLIGGVGPAFIPNYAAIICLRFLMGCGIGLFNPFSVSLMYRFYKEDELADMLGYQNTSQTLGNAAFGFLLGALILMGWKVAFIGYFIALIPMVLFGFFVTFPDEKVADKQEVNKKEKEKINTHVILLSILFMVIFGLVLTMTIKMASFVVEQKIGTPAIASSVLAISGLVAMCSSALFGRVRKLLGNFILAVALLGIGIGFFVIATSTSITMLTVGVVLESIFFGWVFPQGFLRLSQVAPNNGGSLAISVILMGINLGAFLSPTVVNAVAQMLHRTTAGSVLAMCGWGFVFLAVFELIYTIIVHKSSQSVSLKFSEKEDI